jgi:endonuclease/exonuclease/phosphatase family metal-dependent hydrolase
LETPNHHIQPVEGKKKKAKRGFFNRMAMLLNHIAAIALLISYLAPYISPENFWFIAFFGLAYPVLFIINIGFVIYWTLLFKKTAFYSLIILISGWSQIRSYAQINPIPAPVHSKNGFKIMSYNVKLFDLYNWSHNIETRGKMFDLIKSESPDIMCIQEFYTNDGKDELNNLDTLSKFQKAKFVHVEYTTTLRKTDHWGIAIFSKYPILKNGKLNFETKGNNTCIYSDILINGDTVRVYNVHLQSIKFGYKDYQFVDDLMNNKETEELQKSKNILKRLKLGYIKRAKQTELVANHISNSPYPVVICGDFNDTPASYTYHTLSKSLNDAFVESGKGFGRSYVGKFPSFRIDYILHGNEYKASGFRTIRKELSDHFPVVTYLEKN